MNRTLSRCLPGITVNRVAGLRCFRSGAGAQIPPSKQTHPPQSRNFRDTLCPRRSLFPKARSQGHKNMEAEQISEKDVRALGAVSDRYALKSILGRGASATVYLADDLEVYRSVVVKLLSAAESDSEGALTRFHREIES